MNVGELENLRYEIASRAQVKRSIGDIEGAKSDEEMVHKIGVQLRAREQRPKKTP